MSRWPLDAASGPNSSARSAARAPEVDRLTRHGQPARVEPRKVEQVGGELRQTVDLLAHRGQELAPRGFVELFVVEQLEEPGQREQRRAQLVRGVGDELPARVVEMRQADAHPLERRRQRAELAAARVHNRLVEAAVRNPVGRALQPPDSAREHPRAPVAEQKRDQQRHAGGEQNTPLDEPDAPELDRVAHEQRVAAAEYRGGGFGIGRLAVGDRSVLRRIRVEGMCGDGIALQAG